MLKVLEEEVDTLSELQREIDDQLEKDKIKRVKTRKYANFTNLQINFNYLFKTY